MKEVAHDGEREELLTAKQLMVSTSGEQDFSTGFLSQKGNVTSPIWD